MNVSVVEKAGKVEGWVFLPVKPENGKKSAARPSVPGLPIAEEEWNAPGEACGPLPQGMFYKAGPLKLGVEAVNGFRDALGKGLRYLSSRKVKSVAVVLPKLAEVGPEILTGLFEVPDLLDFDSSPYKTRAEAKKPFTMTDIRFVTPDRTKVSLLSKTLDRTRKLMAGLNVTRMLADEPANVMNPDNLARHAMRLKKDGVKVSLLSEAEMKKMGGVQAVNAGSANAPRFIRMELNPGKEKPVVFIGKAVTFDTGGISIKPADLMWEMKGDMAGGAAVIGAMKALALLGCKKHVIGLVPAVENMPDGKATRPGDVVRMYDGQTVEVLNTDAEGRLILADALAYAAKLAPEYVIDLATLTGAIIVALGPRFSGLFCNDSRLEKRVLAAAVAGNELAWPMPMHPMFAEEMKSSFADWKNAAGRKGGACLAAGFLSAFAKGPWAHLDIAGPAMQEKETPVFLKGAGTGAGVRLLVHLLMP